MTEYRKYDCGYYRLSAPATSCFFCKHCTDIWFDFTDGPYMFLCDVNADTNAALRTGECGKFVKEDE